VSKPPNDQRPEVLIGTTPFVLASKEPPPMSGWWKTRLVRSPNLLPQQRRWFDAETKTFSRAVFVGYTDDAEAERIKNSGGCNFALHQLEWCGLSRNPESAKS
jgi:hypothetical protein